MATKLASKPRDAAAESQRPRQRTVMIGDWLDQAIERGRTEAFAIVADIGPEEAQRLLANNPQNRLFDRANTTRLEHDLAAGRWQFNGESIIVADSGELNDGQHRLQAVIKTGTMIRTVIVFGVSRESRATLDMGNRRDLADQLALAGFANVYLASAVTRLVMGWEQARGESVKNAAWLTIPELLERALADPAIHHSASYALRRNAAAHSIIRGSSVGFCHYVFSRVDPVEAENFMDRVTTGHHAPRGDPAFVTRAALMRTTSSRRADHIAMVFRGWVADQAGAAVRLADITDELPLPSILPPGTRIKRSFGRTKATA